LIVLDLVAKARAKIGGGGDPERSAGRGRRGKEREEERGGGGGGGGISKGGSQSRVQREWRKRFPDLISRFVIIFHVEVTTVVGTVGAEEERWAEEEEEDEDEAEEGEEVEFDALDADGSGQMRQRILHAKAFGSCFVPFSCECAVTCISCSVFDGVDVIEDEDEEEEEDEDEEEEEEGRDDIEEEEEEGREGGGGRGSPVVMERRS